MTYAHFDMEQLDRNEQEALAVARMDYLTGRDKGAWWRALRAMGWISRSNANHHALVCAVDLWINRHPSWCERMAKRP